MAALIFLLLNLAASLFKSKSRLEAENAALRHQLIVLQRKLRGRVQFTNSDRLFFIQLYRWCSTDSAAVGTALFVGFPATMAESDFSRPCIIGYGSSPSRCGPAAVAERSIARSPGSRAKSVCTCQVLRPRRIDQALAILRLFVFPSALETESTPGGWLSRINGRPFPSPTDASSPSSRPPTPGSAPMSIATPSSYSSCTTPA